MSVLSADERGNPDSLLYYAPARYRRVRGGTSIRPVLERLSRGQSSPSLTPEIECLDDEMLSAPAPVLAPDPFSVVGKVTTVAVCLAAITAGAIYLFVPGEEDAPVQQVAAQRADRLAVAPPPSSEPEPQENAHETVAVAVEPAAEPPPKQQSPLAAEPMPAFDPITVAPVDVALAVPLKMWGMFPADAAAPVSAESSELSARPAVAETPPQPPPRRRAHRARARTAPAQTQASDAQTAPTRSPPNGTVQVNPIQAALSKIFGAKQ